MANLFSMRSYIKVSLRYNIIKNKICFFDQKKTWFHNHICHTQYTCALDWGRLVAKALPGRRWLRNVHRIHVKLIRRIFLPKSLRVGARELRSRIDFVLLICSLILLTIQCNLITESATSNWSCFSWPLKLNTTTMKQSKSRPFFVILF